MLPMHDFTEETERLARAIEAYARDRIALPQPWRSSYCRSSIFCRSLSDQFQRLQIVSHDG